MASRGKRVTVITHRVIAPRPLDAAALLDRSVDAHPASALTIHEGNTSTCSPLAAPRRSTRRSAPADRRARIAVLSSRRRPLLLAPSRSAGRAVRPLKESPDPAAVRRAARATRIIDPAAAAADVELQAQAEIDGVRLLASLAFEGYGPAIVPATSVPRWLKGDFQRVPVPELPRRVVGWVQRRRPAPGIPTRVLLAVLRDVIALQGPKQPGVHVGTEAFPLGRAV